MKGDPFIYCLYHRELPRTIRTNLLFPDLTMTNFMGEKINFSDLTTGAVIGEGGAAKGVQTNNMLMLF
jgi:hypothetical protein